MNCRRCQGLMTEDQFLDFKGTHGFMWTTGWRCVNCGHVYYSMIEQHRLVRQEKVLVLPSGEPDYQDDEVHLGAESFIRIPA
jgi:hypothetical protein